MDCTARSLLSSSICLARRTSRGRSGDVADRGARVHAGDEAELGARTCCRSRRGCVWSSSASPIGRSGSLAQAAQRLVLVPVRAEQVGAEVADDLGPPGRGATSSTIPSEKPTAHRGVGLEHDPGLVGRARPALARVEHPPGALHLEVRVQGPPLAVGPRSIRVSRCLPRETVSTTVPPARSAVACCGHPEVGAGQHLRRSASGRAAGRRGRRCRPQARQPQPSRRGDEAGGAAAPRAAGSARCRAAARRRPSRPSAGPASRGARPRRATAAAGVSRSGSSDQVSRVRPPRST